MRFGGSAPNNLLAPVDKKKRWAHWEWMQASYQSCYKFNPNVYYLAGEEPAIHILEVVPPIT